MHAISPGTRHSVIPFSASLNYSTEHHPLSIEPVAIPPFVKNRSISEESGTVSFWYQYRARWFNVNPYTWLSF
ncbi:hypothetical protein SCLCIDRAFT_1217146 [Scleroderma citrinum Foug A]|uniref:Uncharacterized protein n=1 Tax=Scleroderma citrinum Foug A TaxID=1036808 RepID=A0A0C3DVD5_9AGAM|nr:hypothetical protein SCLCIDRAFT_1217146 [Scleroderma citrinum Foug A]